MGRTFASLKYHNYRVWFFAALIANTGTWMQRIAQDWLVIHDLTDNDAFAVGVVTALQFLPVLFIMPVAGALADRFDKRKMVFLTQLGMMVLALGLGALVLTGAANVVNVSIFALLLGVVAAFDGPPRLTFISELVPPRSLPNAVGLNSMCFNIARLIGPAVAGGLISLVGTGWVFIINGAMFLATLSALLVMRANEFHPAPVAEKKESTLQGIRHGMAYVSKRSDLLLIFCVVGIASCLALNNQLTTAAMSTSVFDRGAGEFGIVGSILAVGSLRCNPWRAAHAPAAGALGGGCNIWSRRGHDGQRPYARLLALHHHAYPHWVLHAGDAHRSEYRRADVHRAGNAREGGGPVSDGEPGRYPARRAPGGLDLECAWCSLGRGDRRYWLLRRRIGRLRLGPPEMGR